MTEIHQVGVGDIKVVKMMMDRCNTEEQMKSIKVQQQLKRKIAEKPPATEQLAPKKNTKIDKIYQVVVHGMRGEKMLIDLSNTEEQMKSMTVLQLKKKVAQRLPGSAGETVDTLRLIFANSPLDNSDQQLSHYGIQDKSVILMVLRVPGGLEA